MDLESSNLILRKACFSDLESFAEWESKPDVPEFLYETDERTYEEEVTNFVLFSRDKTKELYTILLKPDMKPIGRLSLVDINHDLDSCNIARLYIADPELRGKGYGGEAMRLIVEYAFIQLHMERVTAYHIGEGDAVGELAKDIGFKEEGTLRHAGKIEGRYIDLHLLSLLRAEYYDKLHRK